MYVNDMYEPRIGYKYVYKNTSRYTFLYPNADGYKNWRWTDFDSNLQKHIENISKGYSVASHTNQPSQPNGKSFLKNMEDIFKSENILEKDLESRNKKGILSGIKDLIFDAKNDNKLYLFNLNKNNRSHFFKTRDIGCFWYIFILKDSSCLNRLFNLINRENLNNDNFLEDISDITCVFYRDYLNNSISILANEIDISSCIEEYASTIKIPVFNKKVDNIFDNLYIDNLSERKINESKQE